MFSSKSKDSQPASFAPVPSKRTVSAPSIVSADMVIQGAINSAGDVQVDGQVEGDVRSLGLVIGEKAEIRGEIFAEDITVRGKVVGRIHARKVLLAATSHVEGDILHEAFSVESGAFFEGNCRHSDNPLGDIDLSASRRPAPAAASTPAPAAAQPTALFAPISQPANQTA
jgi:cytoskeletal protein CcmA (bactofilin family)